MSSRDLIRLYDAGDELKKVAGPDAVAALIVTGTGSVQASGTGYAGLKRDVVGTLGTVTFGIGRAVK